jgi:hypothetical protein
MPNHVTNRLEINADRETVQKVMNFLKGKTDDDNTPCYIDFNNIIPMPEELLIEKSSSGDLGMKYLEAMQLKPFYFLLENHSMDRRIGGKGQKRSAATWSIVFGKSEKVRLSHLVRVVYRHMGYKMECLSPRL